MAPAVTTGLQDIHHAETKAAALAAIGVITEKFAPAVDCLTKWMDWNEGGAIAES